MHLIRRLANDGLHDRDWETVLLCAMDPNVTAMERVFQLAKTGLYLDIEQLKQQLKREGYSRDQIQGRSLYRQLQEIIRLATQTPCA